MDLHDLKHKIEDFDLQRFREGANAKAAVGAAVVAVLFLVFVLTRCGGGGAAPRSANEQYFFDLNTRQLVAVPRYAFSPREVGSGTFDFSDGTFGSAVEAMVVSCSDCADVAPGMTPKQLETVDAKIAYLRRLAPAASEILAKKGPEEPLTDREFFLIDSIDPLYSTPAGKTWLPQSSGPAVRLAKDALLGCGDGEPARRCTP